MITGRINQVICGFKENIRHGNDDVFYLYQLILGCGGDYLHACLYTRILTRTAKENYSSSAYINIRTRGIAFCSAKNRAKQAISSECFFSYTA